MGQPIDENSNFNPDDLISITSDAEIFVEEESTDEYEDYEALDDSD